MRCAVGSTLLLFFVACGPQQQATHIDRVTVTDVTPDAGAGQTTEPTDDGPPTAGTSEDVLGRVFGTSGALGSAPSVPGCFGTLKPGMSRKDAKKARPKVWGDAWSGRVDGETDVTVSAGNEDGSDDPVGRLVVEFKQRDAVARLTTAWGAPSLTSFSKSIVCWLDAKAKLKACHSKDLDHDVMTLVMYTPLMDALGKNAPHTPSFAYPKLGASKADIQKAYPGAVEYDDPNDHSQHRLEVAFPTNEYTADTAPDRTVFYLDKSEKVVAIHLWYGANDPSTRDQVKSALTDAVKQVDASDDTLVQIRDEDQGAVVVVLDRTPKLH
jgi:hypothetical protein